MKKYQLTEKQFEELKSLLEAYTDAPKSIADDINEEMTAEGGEAMGALDEAIREGLCESNRDFKFLLEDIELKNTDSEAKQSELAALREMPEAELALRRARAALTRVCTHCECEDKACGDCIVRAANESAKRCLAMLKGGASDGADR